MSSHLIFLHAQQLDVLLVQSRKCSHGTTLQPLPHHKQLKARHAGSSMIEPEHTGVTPKPQQPGRSIAEIGGVQLCV